MTASAGIIIPEFIRNRVQRHLNIDNFQVWHWSDVSSLFVCTLSI